MPISRHSSDTPVFRSAFQSPDDEYNRSLGVRPVVFDILAPDLETSVLPANLKMVLHVNPQSIGVTYGKVIERVQTRGGYVEQHWGEGPRSLDFKMVTGGFMRLYSGLSNITGGGHDAKGNRRETIAYDKYLDMLALFHNNGSVYDTMGRIVFQGIIKVTYDGGIYLGWFDNFNVSEVAEKPYMFDLSAKYTIHEEVQRFRSAPYTATTAPRTRQHTPKSQSASATAAPGVETAPSTAPAPTAPPGEAQLAWVADKMESVTAPLLEGPAVPWDWK